MTKDLLLESKKYIDNPDIIIDMYDFSVEWMSDDAIQMLGKPRSEVIGKIAYFLEDLPMKKAQELSVKDMEKREGINEYPVKTKRGTILIKAKFKIFKYNSTYYYTATLVSFKPYKK